MFSAFFFLTCNTDLVTLLKFILGQHYKENESNHIKLNSRGNLQWPQVLMITSLYPHGL